jgi:hypothetical protein
MEHMIICVRDSTVMLQNSVEQENVGAYLVARITRMANAVR